MSKVGNQDLGGLAPIPAGTPVATVVDSEPVDDYVQDKEEQPVQPNGAPGGVPAVEKPAFTPTAYAYPVLPEAGGIVWTEMHGVKKHRDGSVQTFKVNVTGRGRSAKEAFANLVELITDGKMSLEEFRKSCDLSLFQYVPPSQSAPAVNKLANIDNPILTGTPVQPTGTPPAVQSAQELGGVVTGGIINVVALDITPRADGKVSLAFFGNDRKQPRNQYADLTWVTDVDHAIEKLKVVTGFAGQHFKVAGTYNLPCKLHWVPSAKKNANGIPYKNVDHFEAA